MAWRRRRAGAQAFSLCGVAHSISAPRMHDALGELLVAPLTPWDALVCPSVALRDAVARILDGYEAYLAERLRARAPILRPRLPVIPLGVDWASRDPAAPANAAARRGWRARLGIAEDDFALVFVGRLSLHEKANPAPLFLALREASARLPARPHLILAGWFASPDVEAAFRAAAAALCPLVTLHAVDARAPGDGATIWHAGDAFCSLSDTLQ